MICWHWGLGKIPRKLLFSILVSKERVKKTKANRTSNIQRCAQYLELLPDFEYLLIQYLNYNHQLKNFGRYRLHSAYFGYATYFLCYIFTTNYL